MLLFLTTKIEFCDNIFQICWSDFNLLIKFSKQFIFPVPSFTHIRRCCFSKSFRFMQVKNMFTARCEQNTKTQCCPLRTTAHISSLHTQLSLKKIRQTHHGHIQGHKTMHIAKPCTVFVESPLADHMCPISLQSIGNSECIPSATFVIQSSHSDSQLFLFKLHLQRCNNSLIYHKIQRPELTCGP